VAFMVLSPIGVAAGASGSIFGVFGAMLAYALVHKRPVWGFPMANLFIMILINVAIGFTGAMGNVANSAHIGGLVAGFLVAAAIGLIEKNIKRKKD
ncbi:MAG: rhomboid family intramembrane serine protease, partial [Defluviitaleaceae bacterium]|nr:rhomboid family intramembrane serine protease [Defluviitaleaceae bacterium]